MTRSDGASDGAADGVRRDPTTVRRRLVLATGGVAALVAVLLVVVVHLVLDGAARGAVDQVLTDRGDAVVEAARGGDAADGFGVPDELLDLGVAVYDGDGRRVAGTVPPRLGEVFDQLSRSTGPEQVLLGEAYAARATPFTTDAGEPGVVVVAAQLAPYENDERVALLVSVAAGALMVLLTVVVTSWVGHRALAPVSDMARTAEEWSEHDLDRRFDLGPPTDEVRALGHTLDGLLERVAQAIRGEQRLTSELAHELRTPLTALQATAELALLRPDLDDELREDLDDIHEAARSMAATIGVLLEIARRQAGDLAGDATGDDPGDGCTGAALAEGLRRHYRDRPGPRTDLPPDLELRVPVDVAVRALVPVVDNGLRLAGEVRVGARPAGPRHVELVVSDDGPGVEAALRETLFSPGVSSGGSGLGLSLARRVARSAGGDVRLDEAAAGRGACFVVSLPGSVPGPAAARATAPPGRR